MTLRKQMSKVRQLVSSYVFSRPVNIHLEQPIVSLTFDDVHESVYLNGVPLLDSYGAQATFYISAGQIGSGAPVIQTSQIQDLIEKGHEIGCHTFNHLRTGHVPWKALKQDLDRNQDFFAQHCSGYNLENFSYPGGSIGMWNKKALAKRFSSLRGNYQKINSGRTDLNTLGAVRLYSASLDAAGIDQLVQRVESQKGWLIVYTHDINDEPSPVGCTLELFDHFLKTVRESKCVMETVKTALAKVS